MTSVGVLTRHCYPNYGSLLQAHALASALADAGADSTVIDYVPDGDRPLRLAGSSLKDSRMRGNLASRAAFYSIQEPNLGVAALRFRAHQRRLLCLSQTVSNTAGLAEVSVGYDAIVAGSDQIWNRIHGAIDPHYFLNYLADASTVARHSYAASFGSDGPAPEDEARVLAMIRRLDSVSVREPSAAARLAASGIDARVDVDPVLLHGSDFWDAFATTRGDHRDTNGTILVYQLHNTPTFDTRLDEVARRHSLPVIRIGMDAKQFCKRGRFDYLLSPQKFVAHFRDAAFVITDSFHGAAFSLTFGTPLYLIPPEKNVARNLDLLTTAGVGQLAIAYDADIASADPHYDGRLAANRLGTASAESWNHVRTVATDHGR